MPSLQLLLVYFLGLLSVGLQLFRVPPSLADGGESKATDTSIIFTFEPVVVTAPAMHTPLAIHFDPKAPQQPLPAQDGAAFLKTVPGMSIIRKGGIDGDPVFRGMAGSRLGILLDGEHILGGCGMRMDPPTAYIYPEAYDRLTILKGPQTVTHGPGNSAGVVLFERDLKRFERHGLKLNGSVMGGRFGRHDEVLDVTVGTPHVYVRGLGTNSHSDNYEDGDGKEVHSRYDRWSATGVIGWTPDQDTRLEFSSAHSDGEAAYADRGVDGSSFARANYGLKFKMQHITSWLEQIEAQAYYNYIDHVMDDYSLRTFTPAGMGHEPSAMNPDRLTEGGRIAADLNPAERTTFTVGADLQTNKHTNRNSMSMSMMGMYSPGQWTNPYQHMPRVKDAYFEQEGVFVELTQFIGDQDRVIAGLRTDWWMAEDKRKMLDMTIPNPNANDTRTDTLISGFVRYEHDLGGSSTLYAGLGHSERFPDYWELFYKEGATSSDLNSFATTDPEKTTQLDIGATWKSGQWNGFLAGFYNTIADFIMVQSNVTRGLGMSQRTVTLVRNIDATTWGGEAGVGYALIPHLKLDTSLAYVYGQNDAEDRPLAQMPPLEGRIGLNWDNKTWFLGSLWRLVSWQDRYAINEGTIVGQDIGRTPGFGVFSVNGGWRPLTGTLIAAGIDNLLDKTYAEHISRSGNMIAGFDQTTRVNEPGRIFWLKASYAF